MTSKLQIHIPNPQRGNQPGTWAYHTISQRFPAIGSRILLENNFSSEIEERLKRLIADIPEAAIRPIIDPRAPDLEAWQIYVEPYLGQNWYQPPWFFTEHYFYRRILEATHFFQTGEGGGMDPFSYQKRKGLEVSSDATHRLTERLSNWVEAGEDPGQILERLIYLDLWGNQADLSMWPAEGKGGPEHTDLHQAQAHILVNQAETVARSIADASPLSRVDFLVDNAGFEVVSDLVASDYLLSSKIALAVRLHVKNHPTYVSDAMEKDIRATIEFLRSDPHKSSRELGERLRIALKSGQLQVQGNWFWNSPLDGWLMPVDLIDELGQADLVISKGDANYRRLMGDRHWRYTTKFENILSYFPTALLALRTLKSELVVGLEKGQSVSTADEDPDWLVDGRWGVIQYYPGPAKNLESSPGN